MSQRGEQGVIVQVRPRDILVEDDFGEFIYVSLTYVVGTPRIGATVTLTPSLTEGIKIYRAFVEPTEATRRVLSNPDESGVIFVGGTFVRYASQQSGHIL
jgi:hypothetical protein